jgi:hypothetical protein
MPEHAVPRAPGQGAPVYAEGTLSTELEDADGVIDDPTRHCTRLDVSD